MRAERSGLGAGLLQRVPAVFAYAIASGRARHNPASELRGTLAPRPKVQHFATLSEKEMPEFLRALTAYQQRAKSSPIVFAATCLLALTFVRTGEVRNGASLI
jgi:integrase